MSELVANCPRCKAEKITFDLTQGHLLGLASNGWQRCFEGFCVCRNCKKSTIFVLFQKDVNHREYLISNSIASIKTGANNYLEVISHISTKDESAVIPPEYLPTNVDQAFREGATCLSVNCVNAASTMFRLCLDMATAPLLPATDEKGLNSKTRRDLGLRLPWLFENNKLPESLRDLSHCIKEDGNDAAHRGTLGPEDAEDILDFTVNILETIYTLPAKIKIANERRALRRAPVTK
jgi:hypothetical protein